MKVLLTGADGFLGWHTRARIRALTDHEVVPVTRANWSELPGLVAGVDAILHVAGVNRATPDEVEQGNLALARDVAAAVEAAGTAPRIVFANSIQSGNGTPYGSGKGGGSQILANAARAAGSHYVDVLLPNLFGEHGRPHYNSFVATFVHAVIGNETPTIQDRPVDLLHVQRAAQALIDALVTPEARLTPAGTAATVLGVFKALQHFDALYASGDIPPLLTDLDVGLFNTLRAARFPAHSPIPLTQRVDQRGELVEVVRAHGGQGQTFVSTTKPGITRGEHFHLRKVERFAVIGGQARISLRRLFSGEVVSFDVTDEVPVVVDMPTLWVHNIVNTGDTALTTLFWTNELFDPRDTDTFPEAVALA